MSLRDSGFDGDNGGNSDNGSSQKSKKSKSNPPKTSSASAVAVSTNEMPTVEEVCSTFGLKDVKLPDNEADFRNLTNYKIFTKHVRPILAKENPKVPRGKIMMLVEAKWREFSSQNALTQQNESDQNDEHDSTRKTRQSRTTKKKDFLYNDDDEGDSDHSSSRKSKKSKPTKTSSAPAASAENVIPTVEEVCSTFGLNDVKLQYNEADFQNLWNFLSFTQHVRPILAKGNPKVPTGKIMMLVAAKWKEFSSQNPHTQRNESEQNDEHDSTRKTRRSRSTKESDFLYDDNVGCHSDYEPSQKSKKSKTNPPETSSASTASAENVMPTVEEVCSTFGLNDVKLPYNEADFQNLTNYKIFTKHVRPTLARNNPQVPMGKMMMLVAAKWREFSSRNLITKQNKSDQNDKHDSSRKISRSRSTKESVDKRGDSDDGFNPKSKKSKTNPPKTSTAPAASTKNYELPTVDEVCSTFGLKDVKCQYNDADFQNLTNYREFTQYIRPILARVNPQVPMGKMMMLVAAKWREFSSQTSLKSKL